jgi:hypothetical protein
VSGQKTKTLPVLTDKQRARANAFLKAMGGKGSVEVTAKPQQQQDRARVMPRRNWAAISANGKPRCRAACNRWRRARPPAG